MAWLAAAWASFAADAATWLVEGGGAACITQLCKVLQECWRSNPSVDSHILFEHWPSRFSYAKWVPEVALLQLEADSSASGPVNDP